MRVHPPPGGVVAFDLAPGPIGVAAGLLTEALPSWFDAWHLPKLGTEGTKYMAFANEIYGFIEGHEPSAIVLEAALPPEAQTDTKTAFKQYGLRAIAHEAAARHSIPISEFSADSIRMETIGRCRWKKGQTKIAVVAHCRRLGLDVTSHDSADAVLAWIFYRQRMMGIPPTGQLFPARMSA